MTHRFRIRSVEFVGEKAYPQGLGMTYDDLEVVVDLDDGEEIIAIERGWERGPAGWDDEVPRISVWIKTPVDEGLT